MKLSIYIYSLLYMFVPAKRFAKVERAERVFFSIELQKESGKSLMPT